MGTERRDALDALLAAARAGRPEARDRLIGAIYDELRRRAGRLMRQERPGHTLQPSALVHEALLRLPEVAEVLGVSVTTVEGDWRFARAWLRGQLGEADR